MNHLHLFFIRVFMCYFSSYRRWHTGVFNAHNNHDDDKRSKKGKTQPKHNYLFCLHFRLVCFHRGLYFNKILIKLGIKKDICNDFNKLWNTEVKENNGRYIKQKLRLSVSNYCLWLKGGGRREELVPLLKARAISFNPLGVSFFFNFSMHFYVSLLRNKHSMEFF